MKIYFSANEIPEFRRFTHHEATRIYRTYYLKSFLHWGQWLGMGVLAACILLWDWLVKSVWPDWFKNPISNLGEILLLFLLGFMGSLAYYLIVTEVIRYLYRRDAKNNTSTKDE